MSRNETNAFVRRRCVGDAPRQRRRMQQMAPSFPRTFFVGSYNQKRWYGTLYYDVKHGHGDGEEGLACLGEAIHENVRAVAVPRGGDAPSRLCPTIHSSWTLRFSTIDSFPCDLKETVIVMGLQRRWRFRMRCIHGVYYSHRFVDDLTPPRRRQ
jgi:hypothetical protein